MACDGVCFWTYQNGEWIKSPTSGCAGTCDDGKTCDCPSPAGVAATAALQGRYTAEQLQSFAKPTEGLGVTTFCECLGAFSDEAS